MTNHKHLFFLGAGAIAEAMIKGIVGARVMPAEQIVVSNRRNGARLEELRGRYGVRVSQDRLAEIARADSVVLAMKPFDVMQALREVRAALSERQLVVSVVAGVATGAIERQVEGARVPVIRAMPNTSSFVQESATAISRGRWATISDVEFVMTMFSALGSVTVVDEGLLDAVTGLSATGPAYFYYVVESLMRAGQDLGLAEEMCWELLVQTMYGAAKMLRETGKGPEELRRQVTSPNGTTMAG
ncbi:MAG TPA: pyrroline-5-carboxylate reductase, partial [Ktedonobacteraceae bacterium]|nr:pyrroline-5-carboxylate reductase [Ktedonobacteraceae bacterium]